MPAPCVLVLAVGGNVSQGILKALRHDGRPLRIIAADCYPLAMGLYTVDGAYVSPWADEPGFIPWLLETCRKESVAAILCGAEPVIRAMACHKDTIERETGARCICSPADVIERCDDKLLTCQWLKEQQLNYPQFADASNATDVTRLRSAVGYPLLAKPRRGGGARGVVEVESDEDLAYVCRKPDYIIQENLGTPEGEYTVGFFVDAQGNVSPGCCMKRELQCGTTYRARLGRFPEVRAEAERIVRALRPLGPCNIQLRDTEGGPVCFEINARFSGTTPIRSHFGFNEVGAALDHFVDGKAVTLPLVTSGIALRYWNELYPDPGVAARLESQGSAQAATRQTSTIEPYGVRR